MSKGKVERKKNPVAVAQKVAGEVTSKGLGMARDLRGELNNFHVSFTSQYIYVCVCVCVYIHEHIFL
jgi:hypothetical protein